MKTHIEKIGREKWNEKSSDRMLAFRKKCNKIKRSWRYMDMKQAYEEHGGYMGQSHTGKGTGSLGKHTVGEG